MTRFPMLVVPVALVAFAAMALTAQAEPSSPVSLSLQQPAGHQMMGGQAAGPAMPDSQMMGMHEKMMADMKAMDVTVDALITKMNAAKGAAKVDAMAEALTAMVKQHKTMHEGMMKMEGQMMMQMHGGGAMPMPMGGK